MKLEPDQKQAIIATGIALVIVVGLLILFSAFSENKGAKTQETPLGGTIEAPKGESKALKAPKSDLLGHQAINDGKAVKYAYKGAKLTDNEVSENVRQQTRGLTIMKEVKSQRTKNSRTYATSKPGEFITEIISGEPQYYRDPSGEWYQAEYAETDQQTWDDATKMTLWDKLFPPAFAADTFYPDPDPESATVDGFTNTNNGPQDWSTKKTEDGDSAGSNDDSSYIVYMSTNSTSGKWTYVTRGHFLFNTASIPDGNTVSTAVFSVYGTEKNNGLSLSPFNIGVYSTNPASNTNIVAGDHDTVGSTAYTDSPISYDSYSTTGYNDFTLNASGIAAVNKTGITKFSTRESNYDAGSSTPTWASANNARFSAYFADHTGTDYDPKLVVTHSAPRRPIQIQVND